MEEPVPIPAELTVIVTPEYVNCIPAVYAAVELTKEYAGTDGVDPLFVVALPPRLPETRLPPRDAREPVLFEESVLINKAMLDWFARIVPE